MRCTVCNAPYRDARFCTRCGIDLMPVLYVRNLAFEARNIAVVAACDGDWDWALAEINRAMEFIGNRADFFLLRGKIHAHLHRYRDALRDWRVALALDAECGAAELLELLAALLNQRVYVESGADRMPIDGERAE